MIFSFRTLLGLAPLNSVVKMDFLKQIHLTAVFPMIFAKSHIKAILVVLFCHRVLFERSIQLASLDLMLRGGANSNLKFLGRVLCQFSLLLNCVFIVSALDSEAMQVKTVNEYRKLNYSILFVKLLYFYLFVAFQ
jgi:hypothetical protein